MHSQYKSAQPDGILQENLEGDAHSIFDFVGLGLPSPKADLGDGATIGQAEHFSERHGSYWVGSEVEETETGQVESDGQETGYDATYI
jgi:hypothetical protein